MPVTPYMAMTLPAVSATLGPQWATELNAALTVADAHDHSSGHGQPVRPAGIYMDADLNFRNVNAYALRSSRYQTQGSLLGSINDVRCIYFYGSDMYVNDAAGNQIQITSGGGIAGTSGSISGLVSPASVVYTPASKRFDFYSNSLIRAALACGPLTIAEAVTNGKGVTISVPAGLPTNYALELPSALPATTQVLTLSTAGLIAASGVPTPVAAGDGANKGYVDKTAQISASSGSFTVTGGTPVDVTNLSVTITTRGRPVMLTLISGEPTVTPSFLGVEGAASVSIVLWIYFFRDSTEISRAYGIERHGASLDVDILVHNSILHIDTPSAGTYTYKVQAGAATGVTGHVRAMKLVAVEL